MDIYRAAKRRGKYPTLATDTEVNSCFSIYCRRFYFHAFSFFQKYNEQNSNFLPKFQILQPDHKISNLIIHQIFSLAGDWSKHVT